MSELQRREECLKEREKAMDDREKDLDSKLRHAAFTQGLCYLLT